MNEPVPSGSRPASGIRARIVRLSSAPGVTRRFPSAKGFLLFLLPVPLLLAAILALGGGKLGAVLANGCAFALFMLGAVLTRRAILAAQEEPQRRFSRRPLITLRNLGGGLTAFATGFAAFFSAEHTLPISIAFAAVALLGFRLVYGLDPVRGRQAVIAGDGEDDAVTDALAEAERRILTIEQAARSIGNSELRQRLRRVGGQGREILDMIARRPRDLRRARKFLTVYLEGAEKVTRGYAETHKAADSRELEQNFRNVLVTIEDVFAEQRQRLLDTDLMDLDVQIEVLTKQLEREGIL